MNAAGGILTAHLLEGSSIIFARWGTHVPGMVDSTMRVWCPLRFRDSDLHGTMLDLSIRGIQPTESTLPITSPTILDGFLLMPRLLVVDDEKLILDAVQYAFPSGSTEVVGASSADEALSLHREKSFDAVLADIRLGGSSGLQLLDDLKAIDPRVPVILMTGQGTANTAIEATLHGAFEYLLKPLDLVVLENVVERAFEASRMSRISVKLDTERDSDATEGDLFVGKCLAMQEVYRQIGRVAGQDVTVLVLGESGTGKEVVARALHQYSRRSDQRFLAINCAAIPENLLESELFGHEKGSFTGADRLRIGKFEQCHGGTLFLDEIGDMTPLTQTKVLRVLQDQRFERVGGKEIVHANVRLIAATSRNLKEMMDDGTFRSDLFYRLNVYSIQLPPLRERTGDLPLLVNHFLKRFARELNKPVGSISMEAMHILAQYRWPGNIRELQSVLKHAVIQAGGTAILPECLPESVRAPIRTPQAIAQSDTCAQDPFEEAFQQLVDEGMLAGSNDLYNEVIQRVDRALLVQLLQRVNGNISRAVSILGMARSTFRNKLSATGISVDRSVRMTEQTAIHD